ncbi:MAG: hypothetical protein AAF541_02535 [Pseudomonadota bacterium]
MNTPSDSDESDELMDDLEDLHNLLDELESAPAPDATDTEFVPTLNEMIESPEAQEDLFASAAKSDEVPPPLLQETPDIDEAATLELSEQIDSHTRERDSQFTDPTAIPQDLVSAIPSDALREEINQRIGKVVNQWMHETLAANMDNLQHALTEEVSEILSQHITYNIDAEPASDNH